MNSLSHIWKDFLIENLYCRFVEQNNQKISGNFTEMIRFNKPYITGKEIEYIQDTFQKGKLSGDGPYTQKCHQFFEERFNFPKCLLTTSCSSALDMTAILLDIQPGDEVIVPSYSFVTTANAFALRGAKIVFADSDTVNPNISLSSLENLITKKTKAIVIIHYGGIACDMDELMRIKEKHNLYLVEDAAQAIDSYYKGKPLGTFGELSTFSFHETKNINCGEGGMLVINDEKYMKRAEIIREKGTNRSEFFRGEVDKYGWVDVGSSFLPSDILAAFLYAQLENIEEIQEKRKNIWEQYYKNLQPLNEKKLIGLPFIPSYATNNGHLFYVICNGEEERGNLIKHLGHHNIKAVFHYLSLHKSKFYHEKHDGRTLPNSDHYSECLLRLPFYKELAIDEVDFICEKIREFYEG